MLVFNILEQNKFMGNFYFDTVSDDSSAYKLFSSIGGGWRRDSIRNSPMRDSYLFDVDYFSVALSILYDEKEMPIIFTQRTENMTGLSVERELSIEDGVISYRVREISGANRPKIREMSSKEAREELKRKTKILASNVSISGDSDKINLRSGILHEYTRPDPLNRSMGYKPTEHEFLQVDRGFVETFLSALGQHPNNNLLNYFSQLVSYMGYNGRRQIVQMPARAVIDTSKLNMN